MSLAAPHFNGYSYVVSHFRKKAALTTLLPDLGRIIVNESRGDSHLFCEISLVTPSLGVLEHDAGTQRSAAEFLQPRTLWAWVAF
jgi:hypothetical protein